MQHPMPKERAEKGVGKRSMNNVGIKVDRPCKPEKKDIMILEEVIKSVDSMQLSKTNERTKKGLGKPLKAQLDMDVRRPISKLERKDKTRLERINSGVRKTSKTKLDSKVHQLPFKPKIKGKMILDGNTQEPVLKRKVHTVFFTDHACSEFTRAVQDGHTNFKDAHISFLERVVGSCASERLFLSSPECFTANITEEEADKIDGMDEVRVVFPPLRF